MKKLKLLILLIALIFVSCNSEKDNLKNEQIKIENIVSQQVKTIQDAKIDKNLSEQDKEYLTSLSTEDKLEWFIAKTKEIQNKEDKASIRRLNKLKKIKEKRLALFVAEQKEVNKEIIQQNKNIKDGVERELHSSIHSENTKHSIKQLNAKNQAKWIISLTNGNTHYENKLEKLINLEKKQTKIFLKIKSLYNKN